MAFDGITVAAVVKECNDLLTGGRVYKIAQPESDAVEMVVKQTTGTYRLLLSADASLPLCYLADDHTPSPMTAPGFCMLLRKHLQNGRITNISQPGLERVIQFEIEHYDEMGDLRHKKLTLELMGKHSNLILVDETDTIVDSIKHISSFVSSVREVLPGKPYFIPETTDKSDPLTVSEEDFVSRIFGKATPLYKAIYGSLTGISPVIAQELCYEAELDADRSALSYRESEIPGVQLPDFEENARRLFSAFDRLRQRILHGSFTCAICYEQMEKGKKPVEFAAVPLTMYKAEDQVCFDSISALLRTFYAQKNAITRIRQKSADLRHIVQTALERDVKKYDLQLKQMEDTAKRDDYRIYGELLHTYGYQASPGAKSLKAVNYYTGEEVTIPLDPTLTPAENAKRYFDKYGKMKRTYEALSSLTLEVKAEIDHLESIATALDIAEKEEDLTEIREELIACGYIRRKGGSKKVKITSKPYHYISQDGFHIYVGKNNFQNDALTFKLATGNDWWFHAKKIPGSHVVLKTEGKEVPDRAFEDAARLAAHYSKASAIGKAEIDYLQKKNVKKPAGAKPGFVVYYTNYSMVMDTDISMLTLVND
ncbi:MAG: NFACT family protein [Lachnospiraceae bacterium]|nr:NFACT family protein [Lachnospiraceae bacterium]